MKLSDNPLIRYGRVSPLTPAYLRPIRGAPDNGARTYCARRHSMEARFVSDYERHLSNHRRRKSGGEWRCLTPSEGLGTSQTGKESGSAGCEQVSAPPRQTRSPIPAVTAQGMEMFQSSSYVLRSISGPGLLSQIISLRLDHCCCQTILCA